MKFTVVGLSIGDQKFGAAFIELKGKDDRTIYESSISLRVPVQDLPLYPLGSSIELLTPMAATVPSMGKKPSEPDYRQ